MRTITKKKDLQFIEFQMGYFINLVIRSKILKEFSYKILININHCRLDLDSASSALAAIISSFVLLLLL